MTLEYLDVAVRTVAINYTGNYFANRYESSEPIFILIKICTSLCVLLTQQRQIEPCSRAFYICKFERYFRRAMKRKKGSKCRRLFRRYRPLKWKVPLSSMSEYGILYFPEHPVMKCLFPHSVRKVVNERLRFMKPATQNLICICNYSCCLFVFLARQTRYNANFQVHEDSSIKNYEFNWIFFSEVSVNFQHLWFVYYYTKFVSK